MNKKSLRYMVLAAACGLLMAGCALNEQVRIPPGEASSGGATSQEPVATADGSQYSSIEKYTLNTPPDDTVKTPFSHTTAYIEFDEQGDFLDRKQLEAALADQPIYHDPKRLLIFYAHGWQNNTRSRDVALFNQFIAHLNEALNRVDDQYGKERWTVYGVYLAWRGTNFQPVDYVDPHDSSQVEPNLDAIQAKTDVPLWAPVTSVKYFTFWSRKAAAARFAGGPLLETIQAISNKVRGENNSDGTVMSRTILMGHSFGAYILEKTLLQSMAADEVPGKSGSITPPADLVVLLNSAAPAIYAKEFIDYLKWHNVGKREQPFIVSITSEADDATKLAFPAGTIPGTLFDVGSYQSEKTYNGAPEKFFFTHTPGHCDYIVSHNVVPVEDVRTGAAATFAGGQDEWLLHENLFAGSSFEEDIFKPFDVKPNEIVLWGDNGYAKVPGEQAYPQKWAVEPANPDGYNNTTYWILRVPKQIIASHGDIWNPNTASLIAGLVRMAGLVPASANATRGLRSLTISDLAQPKDHAVMTKCSPYPLNTDLLH